MSDPTPETTPSTIYPCLTYDDALGAIEWLGKAFGFTQRLLVMASEHGGPEGMVMHSELQLGDGVVMVSSPRPEEDRLAPENGGGTHSLSVYVPDPEAHYARAKEHGVEIIRELQSEDYGARGYMAKDCEGHHWYFADYRPGSWWGGESDRG